MLSPKWNSFLHLFIDLSEGARLEWLLGWRGGGHGLGPHPAQSLEADPMPVPNGGFWALGPEGSLRAGGGSRACMPRPPRAPVLKAPLASSSSTFFLHPLPEKVTGLCCCQVLGPLLGP